MKRTLLIVVFLAIVFSSVGFAQVNKYPIDIPGTNVLFFNLRYEGTTLPFELINEIWERINDVFITWVENGQNPAELTADDVTIGKTTDGEVAIFLKGSLIVIVDEFHARINKTTPQKLAEVWANNLKEGVEIFVKNNTLASM